MNPLLNKLITSVISPMEPLVSEACPEIAGLTEEIEENGEQKKVPIFYVKLLSIPERLEVSKALADNKYWQHPAVVKITVKYALVNRNRERIIVDDTEDIDTSYNLLNSLLVLDIASQALVLNGFLTREKEKVAAKNSDGTGS